MGSLAGLDELFPPGLVDGDEDDGDGAEMVAVLRMMRGGGRDGGGDPRRADHEMKPILISKAFEAQMMRQWAEEDRRGKGMGTLAEEYIAEEVPDYEDYSKELQRAIFLDLEDLALHERRWTARFRAVRPRPAK